MKSGKLKDISNLPGETEVINKTVNFKGKDLIPNKVL